MIVESQPEHCPGPESQRAGADSACAGCPNQSICASGAAAIPDETPRIVAERLHDVKHKILVLSGKGGVGKSTFSSTLAFALSQHQIENNNNDDDNLIDDLDDGLLNIGLMDVDITGPSIPQLAGVYNNEIHHAASGWTPVYPVDNLAVMSIGFLLENKDEAVVWRGAKKNAIIRQFLTDVDWGYLDYLIVDTPPGTSDEHLAVTQYLKESKITGAVLVTTPQELSLQDVRKEIGFCKKVGIPILGVVENMSGFVCPSCTHESDIFNKFTGGAEKMCNELQVNFLGKIPLDPRLTKSCDFGEDFLSKYPESPTAKAYFEIVQKLLNKI